ncbi:hypothetical protein Tco_0900965 [Tanacetum coccineum]
MSKMNTLLDLVVFGRRCICLCDIEFVLDLCLRHRGAWQGAYDLGVATPRALVYVGLMTSGDARSWYMISGDAKSWVLSVLAYIHCHIAQLSNCEFNDQQEYPTVTGVVPAVPDISGGRPVNYAPVFVFLWGRLYLVWNLPF